LLAASQAPRHFLPAFKRAFKGLVRIDFLIGLRARNPRERRGAHYADSAPRRQRVSRATGG
jgi:hypothetical protein